MAHKRSMERKSMAGGAGTATMDPLSQPAGGEDGSQVAQEHGPAVEVNLMHNHEAGEHHVHSKHPDGHEHHSQHGSAAEAHDHAKQLASGNEGGEGMGGEEPEYE